jgi:hypothetical protein
MSDILQQHIPKEWEHIVFKRPRFSLPSEGQIITMQHSIPELWAETVYAYMLQNIEDVNALLAMHPVESKPRQKKGRPSRYRRAKRRRRKGSGRSR